MSKIKFQIKNRWFGSIFEYEAEDNTISKTLKEALKSGADLSGANLSGANNAEYAIAITRVCPEGDIIGWKKCREEVIVKLLIPAFAKRNNAFGRKCRAEYAQVLEIIGPRGGTRTEAYSSHDSSFIYRVGEIVRPTSPFDENFMDECSVGIHFFITKIEAENY